MPRYCLDFAAVRADRLVSLVLLLQVRGLTPASVLASELEVSVRTIYRDIEALSTAGVPVITESGPGGGCRLLEDYRFPLRSLRPDEAEALLILGVPDALAEIGLGAALTAAHRRIGVTAGMSAQALVHLDMPRWFGGQEAVPHLKTMAQAVRNGKCMEIIYRQDAHNLVVAPLGLVNKAGTWYLVALAEHEEPSVFRAARVGSATLLTQPADRPAGFDLAAFWTRWSAEFSASRPRIAVTVRASPPALAALPEIFGDAVRSALAEAEPPDRDGWRTLALTFEHETAAVHRLAGFGDLVEVLEPLEVRARLVATAQAIIDHYQTAFKKRADHHRPLSSGR